MAALGDDQDEKSATAPADDSDGPKPENEQPPKPTAVEPTMFGQGLGLSAFPGTHTPLSTSTSIAIQGTASTAALLALSRQETPVATPRRERDEGRWTRAAALVGQLLEVPVTNEKTNEMVVLSATQGRQRMLPQQCNIPGFHIRWIVTKPSTIS